MTRVRLILPSLTALARLPPVCVIKVNSTILCDIENPLKTNHSKVLFFFYLTINAISQFQL